MTTFELMIWYMIFYPNNYEEKWREKGLSRDLCLWEKSLNHIPTKRMPRDGRKQKKKKAKQEQMTFF
jgi:hypothetical protein